MDGKRRLYSLTKKFIKYSESQGYGLNREKIIGAIGESQHLNLTAAKILENAIKSVGFSQSDAKTMVQKSMEYDLSAEQTNVRKVSPSFKYYKSKDGDGTSRRGYKSVSGGAPGLGKKKS